MTVFGAQDFFVMRYKIDDDKLSARPQHPRGLRYGEGRLLGVVQHQVDCNCIKRMVSQR